MPAGNCKREHRDVILALVTALAIVLKECKLGEDQRRTARQVTEAPYYRI
jgi:hypothetical protein